MTVARLSSMGQVHSMFSAARWRRPDFRKPSETM